MDYNQTIKSLKWYVQRDKQMLAGGADYKKRLDLILLSLSMVIKAHGKDCGEENAEKNR